jgi:broad specificity phosphatase PhoE
MATCCWPYTGWQWWCCTFWLDGHIFIVVELFMTEMVLVRHGQTDWNILGRIQGQTDIPLNDAGLEQARQPARSLPPRAYTAIYSSDLRRARQTAQILADTLLLPVQVDKRLREIHQGEWEGLNIQQVTSQFGANFSATRSDPLNERAIGGESTLDVAARMGEVADAIAREHPQGPVLVVGHGFALAVLRCLANDIPLAEAYTFIPDNARAMTIQWKPGHPLDHLTDGGNA